MLASFASLVPNWSSATWEKVPAWYESSSSWQGFSAGLVGRKSIKMEVFLLRHVLWMATGNQVYLLVIVCK